MSSAFRVLLHPSGYALALAAMGAAVAEEPPHVVDPPQVIELTQTPCQFLEPEKGVNLGFVSRSKRDCEAVNAGTTPVRLQSAQSLRLAPGKYVFRVKNASVPYELGFWLRGRGVTRLTLPSVSGGGVPQGQTQDYAIELIEGDYVYSCPLNPTPDYPLVVRSPN